MRAGDLATPFPDTLAVEAARLLDTRNLPGLIVVDNRGVIDGAGADVFLDEPGAHTVSEVLPEQPRELPVVDPNATVLEIAALLARIRTPLVAVVADGAELLGAITLDRLVDA